MGLLGLPLQMPLDVAHAEFDVVVSVLVPAEAFPVAVNEVLRHCEERGGFIEPKGSVGFRSVMGTGAGARQQVDKFLKQVRKLGFRVRLCSGFFLFHA